MKCLVIDRIQIWVNKSWKPDPNYFNSDSQDRFYKSGSVQTRPWCNRVLSDWLIVCMRQVPVEPRGPARTGNEEDVPPPHPRWYLPLQVRVIHPNILWGILVSWDCVLNMWLKMRNFSIKRHFPLHPVHYHWHWHSHPAAAAGLLWESGDSNPGPSATESSAPPISHCQCRI